MDSFASIELPELNQDLFGQASQFSLLYMITIVFFMNLGFILLARRRGLQRMTLLCGLTVIPSILLFMVKTAKSFFYDKVDIVPFE